MQRLLLILVATLFCLASYAAENDGYLGISIKSYELDAQQGLRIINVFDDGAALAAGIQENDFITQVNGYYVSKPIELINIVHDLQWGDEVELSYIRDGEIKSQTIVLGYQKRIRTYEILKSENSGDTENWYFKDNTTIVLQSGEATSITKKIENENKTLDLREYSDFNQVPQNFLDINDKLFIIEKTKEDQAARNSTANNVVVIKQVVDVEVTNVVENDIDFSEFKVFPNPSNGEFDVVLKAQDLEHKLRWNIYDIQGRSVLNGIADSENGSFTKHISIADVPAGTYLFHVKSGEKTVRQKFVIE